MEAATTTAPRPTAPAVRRSVPPGPPLPMPVQTAIWSRQARRLLYACQDRYGDIFMLKVLRETWAVLADPEHVKQVFTGDPSVFHAGEGNELLEPLLGPHSLLTLDEKPHMSQRRLLLPPFHGERMQAYEAIMAEIAAREIKSWPSGEPYALRPRMQALTLEIILRTVFGVREGEGLGELRDALRRYLELLTDPRQLLPVVAIGPQRIRRLPWFRRAMDRVDELIYAEIAARGRWHRGERMQAYEAIMAEIAAREIKSWPSGEPYALRPRMQALTLEIILRTVFGVREGEGLGELRDA